MPVYEASLHASSYECTSKGRNDSYEIGDASMQTDDSLIDRSLDEYRHNAMLNGVMRPMASIHG